jgi:hypothetical protein
MLAGLFLSCGPIQSTAMLRDAERAIASAGAANASTFAPYEWQRALEYRNQALTEVGHARYQLATDYAQQSKAAAVKALETAQTLNPPPAEEDEP